MSAPNKETTNLTQVLGTGNPDGFLFQSVKITAVANANATVAAANMINAVITMTPDANYTLTTDTYSNFANAIGSNYAATGNTFVPANTCFDFTVQANGATANKLVTLAGGTGVTILGNATCGAVANTAATQAASYKAVFNANSTITIYRLN